jgi:hypothetical protein
MCRENNSVTQHSKQSEFPVLGRYFIYARTQVKAGLQHNERTGDDNRIVSRGFTRLVTYSVMWTHTIKMSYYKPKITGLEEDRFTGTVQELWVLSSGVVIVMEKVF